MLMKYLRPSHGSPDPLGRRTALLVMASVSLTGCHRGDPLSLDADRPPGDGGPSTDPSPLISLEVNAAARGEMFWSPFDACPDPDGRRIFFVALSSESEGPAVFSVESPGATPVALHAGDPFATPFEEVVASDGASLYISDPAAQDDEEGLRTGTIFRLSTTGGAPSSLAGAEGRRPLGLTLAEIEGRSRLFFTGSREDGSAAVFGLDPEGGGPDLVYAGSPLSRPGGIAVAGDGSVCLTDQGTLGVGAVVRIRDGAAEVMAEGLELGFPAGIALNRSDTQLLVSGRDSDTEGSVVYVIDLATSVIRRFNDGIALSTEPAGLGRALRADIFAWADAAGSEDRPGGRVFSLSTRNAN